MSVVHVETSFQEIVISACYAIEEIKSNKSNANFYEYKVQRIEFNAKTISFHLGVVSFMLSKIQCLKVSGECNLYKDLVYYYVYMSLQCTIAANLVDVEEYILLVDVMSESMDYPFLSSWNRSNALFLVSLMLANFNKDEKIPEKLVTCIEHSLIPACLVRLNKIDSDSEMYIRVNELLQQIFELVEVKLSNTVQNKIFDSLCKVYFDSNKNSSGILGLATMNAFFKHNKIKDETKSRKAFDLFYEVFSCLSVKNCCYLNVLEYIDLTECLRFFSIMCEIDMPLINFIRTKIVDFLSSPSILGVEEELEKGIKYWSLKLIGKMIDHSNFEILIMLDTEGINKLINACQTERYSEDEDYEFVFVLATRISNKIQKYKADLRKFYIRNGYAKVLN